MAWRRDGTGLGSGSAGVLALMMPLRLMLDSDRNALLFTFPMRLWIGMSVLKR